MLKVLFNASMLNAKKLPANYQLFTGITGGKEGGSEVSLIEDNLIII